ncbi:MAG: hypothetical protein HRU20_31815, partial [Pseudomonadales bacterium]|nr:hypothetical protein [Pseudomonadales bacterium]
MVDKQQILAGDKQQLSTLIVTHFASVEGDIATLASDQLRLQIAQMFIGLAGSSL